MFTGLRVAFQRLNAPVRPPLFAVDTHIIDGIESRVLLQGLPSLSRFYSKISCVTSFSRRAIHGERDMA